MIAKSSALGEIYKWRREEKSGKRDKVKLVREEKRVGVVKNRIQVNMYNSPQVKQFPMKEIPKTEKNTPRRMNTNYLTN